MTNTRCSNPEQIRPCRAAQVASPGAAPDLQGLDSAKRQPLSCSAFPSHPNLALFGIWEARNEELGQPPHAESHEGVRSGAESAPH